MLHKVCYYFTILVVLFSPEVELRLPNARKRDVDDKALFNDVIKNITRVNNVLEDLIKNYEKLKTLYKSQEEIDDYSTDDEVDEVYKQKKRVRERAKGLLSSTTRNPNELATQMFFSEEHANEDNDDETDASDIENNEKLNEKPKSQKPNNDKPNNDKPSNNKFVIKIAKDKVLEKERERIPQVEFVVHGVTKSETVKTSTAKIEPSTDQPAKLMAKPLSAKQKSVKPKESGNETVVIFKQRNEGVTRSKLPIDTGKMKLISRLRPEAEDENSFSGNSNSADSTFVALSGSFTEGSSDERQQNQDDGYNTSHQQSFENEKPTPNRNRQEKKVSPNNKSKISKRPANNTRTLKKVIKAEEFSYDRIWDEVLHKPVRLDTQKEIVYYKQPKIYFRNQITEETTFKYKEVTLEPQIMSEEIKPTIKAVKQKVQKKPRPHSAQSLEDEKTIMKEQFKTRILRKAYGDACLKVVVKKCYKACKASTKTACKKYNCKSKFKTDFISKAKTNCIKEFREVPPATTRTNDGPYDKQFQEITRNGYLAAACLPTARTSSGKNTDIPAKTDIQLNILRDRFEKACQKVSSDKCTKACETSVDEACKLNDCAGGKKSAFTKACGKECKSAYKYGSSSKRHKKHSGSSGSGSGSDSNSDSGSDSGSDLDLKTDCDENKTTTTTTKAQTIAAVIKRIVISPKQRKNTPLRQRAKLGI